MAIIKTLHSFLCNEILIDACHWCHMLSQLWSWKIGSSLYCFSGYGAGNLTSPFIQFPLLWRWTFTACQLIAFKLASFQTQTDFQELDDTFRTPASKSHHCKRKLDTAIEAEPVNHTLSLELSISVYIRLVCLQQM